MPQGNIVQYFITAEANLEKGATALAQAGVSEQAVQAVSQMAETTRQIVSQLSKGQERTGDDESPQETAPEQQPVKHTMESATRSLGNDMQASATRRRAEGTY